MKQVLGILLSFFLFTSTSYAATMNIGEGMKHKAIRGAVNLVTGIVEVPMQIYKGYNKGFGVIENEIGSKAVGTIIGIFRGFGHAAGRISWGGMELFGFWTANHPNNEGVGIPFDGQYAWHEGEMYDLFDPSFSEQVKPVGRKLVRGVTDAIGGIAEVPGEAIEGYRNGQLIGGIGRGLWYWLSREVYGFTGIYTCIVPNPADNPGYAFDGEYPWSIFARETK